jgi:GH15 family glucan-1,4-alpha-glucosidase
MAWTVAAVWAGLQAGANFAAAFGDGKLAHQWRRDAQEIREAAIKHLYVPSLGRFVRRIVVDVDGNVQPDTTIDASMIGLMLFGMFSAHDPRIAATMHAIEGALMCKSTIGGVARYENDYYYQVSHDISKVAGNPWFICTLWLADYYIHTARSVEELQTAARYIGWVADHALPSGVLAEQVHPYTGEPLSVSPLTWSHAGFVMSVQAYVAKWTALTSQSAAHHGAPASLPSASPMAAPMRPMESPSEEPVKIAGPEGET